MIRGLLFACLVIVCQVVPGYAETVKVAGEGGMIPLMNELAQAYMKKNPKDTIVVNQNSLGKIGGVLAVKEGAYDIGMTAKRLDKNMRKQPLYEYEIARMAVLFHSAPLISLTNLKNACFRAVLICQLTGGHW